MLVSAGYVVARCVVVSGCWRAGGVWRGEVYGGEVCGGERVCWRGRLTLVLARYEVAGRLCLRWFVPMNHENCEVDVR